VVVVPYDFRHCIEQAAERLDAVVRARLDDVDEAARAARVIVVAHSMGGLVARYWLGPLGRWAWCRALITVGTPHRGASKALDWLVNGVRLCGVRLGGPSRLVWDWPAVAQLLPRYPVVRNLTARPTHRMRRGTRTSCPSTAWPGRPRRPTTYMWRSNGRGRRCPEAARRWWPAWDEATPPSTPASGTARLSP
jgi:pimeloyl-ACP methyl ester carboxylesterase